MCVGCTWPKSSIKVSADSAKQIDAAAEEILQATGVVTVEHTSAVLLQANIPTSGPGQAKIDDLVLYRLVWLA